MLGNYCESEAYTSNRNERKNLKNKNNGNVYSTTNKK